jgi:hypothetical protein
MVRLEIPIMKSGFRFCNAGADPEEKKVVDREVGNPG